MSNTKENNSELINDNFLRPQKLNEYFGQNVNKENLKIYIEAAKRRNDVLDHVLLYGPPGLGKTTLAYVIANELGRGIITISGPTVEKIGDMAVVLNSLKPGDVLFIDEIHRLPKVVEEFLYSVLEDYTMTLFINHENDSENISIKLPPFTLVGATTKISCLSSPLRDRFGITLKLDFYKVEEIEQIVQRSASLLGDRIDDKASYQIAIRSRGTPRIANRIFKRVRDFSNYAGKRLINEKITKNALEKIGIDELGLDEIDVQYLSKLINRFKGGPVGIETLASSFGEDSKTLEEVCEPYLIALGFINRTKQGREITDVGKTYFLRHHFDNKK